MSTLNPYRQREPFPHDTVVEINVPSGRVLISDDLRGAPKYRLEPPASLNYRAGLDDYARLFAEQANMAYAFVGNSCPSVYREERTGDLIVMNPAYDEETDDYLAVEGATKIATVCTDLWATMIVDYEEWLAAGGDDLDTLNGRNAIDWAYTVVEIPAGRYRWTAFSHNEGFDIHGEGLLTYARLERIPG